jgi:hypothetical protein
MITTPEERAARAEAAFKANVRANEEILATHDAARTLACDLAELMPDRRLERLHHRSDADDLGRVIAQAYGIQPFGPALGAELWRRSRERYQQRVDEAVSLALGRTAT